jgi:hypothetical protein
VERRFELGKESARIKTTLKCCFYRKRRSFVNEQGRREQPRRIYKTSDRSERKRCKTNYKRKAGGSMPVAESDERSERNEVK